MPRLELFPQGLTVIAFVHNKLSGQRHDFDAAEVPSKLDKRVLEFSGVAHPGVGADEPFDSDTPSCRLRCVAVPRCTLYTNPPASSERRQGS